VLVAGVEVAKNDWIQSAGREGGNFKDNDQEQWGPIHKGEQPLKSASASLPLASVSLR